MILNQLSADLSVVIEAVDDQAHVDRLRPDALPVVRWSLHCVVVTPWLCFNARERGTCSTGTTEITHWRSMAGSPQSMWCPLLLVVRSHAIGPPSGISSVAT